MNPNYDPSVPGSTPELYTTTPSGERLMMTSNPGKTATVDSDFFDDQGRRIRVYVRPDGQKLAAIVPQSGGSKILLNPDGSVAMEMPDDRIYDENGFLSGIWAGGGVGGLQQANIYRRPDGSTYAVGAGYGPQFPGDVKVPFGPDYGIRLPDGSIVRESEFKATQQNMQAGIQPQLEYDWRTGRMVPKAQAAYVPPPQDAPATFTAPGGGGAQAGQSATNINGTTDAAGNWTPPANMAHLFPNITPPAAPPSTPSSVAPTIPNFFSTNPFTTPPPARTSSGSSTMADALALYQTLLKTGTGSTTPSSRPAPTQQPSSPYTELQDRLLQQMMAGGAVTIPGTTGTTAGQIPLPTFTAPGVPNPALVTPQNPMGLPLQPGNTTGNPNWIPAATGSTGTAYKPTVAPDNYQQVKAMEDLRYLATRGPTDFINFPGQGGAQSMSKTGGVNTGSWTTTGGSGTRADTPQTAQAASAAAGYTPASMQSTYSDYMNQYGNQLSVPQWTSPSYPTATQTTAQNVQWQPSSSTQYGNGGPVVGPQYVGGVTAQEDDYYDPYGGYGIY